MKKENFVLLMLMGSGLVLYGQFLPSPTPVDFSYPATVIPSDTTQLWIQDGNSASDTVLILCQGGPDKFLGVEINGKSVWRYLPTYKRYQVAHLHQAQTLNPAIFDFQGEFSLAMAQHEVELSEEMLAQAITYFHSRSKYVIVLGHSYGAFIVFNHLGVSGLMADRYIISGGRLQAPSEMVKDHLKGLNGEVQEDGKTYIPFSEGAYEGPYITERMQKIYRVKQLLKAAIGEPRYTEQIVEKDLSQVTVVYATNDQNVGALNTDELSWLQGRKAQIFTTDDGHYHLYREIVNAVERGEIRL